MASFDIPADAPLPPRGRSGITPAMPATLFDSGAPDVLYIVDLSSYLLRAYHAIAPLSAPTGEPTHAVHGTVTMLERLFRERRPQLLAIAMDSGRMTFRKQLFPDYKANRPPAPDDLRVQIERAEEIVAASGFAIFKQDGVEADDLIASLVREAKKNALRVVIVSADKDLMQLIGKDVLLWDTLRNKVFGEEEVLERFAVGPQQLGDLLALMGDSSDNIPGVPSVGPKTAATLLLAHGDLDGIFAATATIARKKLRETLEENEANARLSRQLVTLKDDCDVDATLENLRFSPKERRNERRLAEIYTELGFSRQLAALSLGKAEIQQEVVERSFPPAEASLAVQSPVALVTSPSSLSTALLEAASGDASLELYTVRPDSHSGPLLGMALCTEKTQSYIPLGHRTTTTPTQLASSAVVRDLVRALTQRKGMLYVHDLKRNLVILHEAGWGEEADTLLGRGAQNVHDTLLGSYLLDPERNHQVEALGSSVGLHVPSYDAFAKEGRKKRNWDELEVDAAAELAALRVRALLHAGRVQRDRLEEQQLNVLLQTVELPLARVLSELERRGVLVDVQRLSGLGQECHELLAALSKEAYAAAQKEFNVNSPRQLETILFDELGLKHQKRTKTSRSTDAQTLEALAEEHELPEIILKIRQISKLVGTYIEALPALVRQDTGRIHGCWEQAVAATGRISSTDPNLQNIPIRSELGRKIRDAFIAPEGHQIVSADYSQIELRVLAHLSQDERLLEAFQTEQDVHTRTAMEIFEVSSAQVTREMRARAKAVNFGVIYGQGENALAKSLGIERKEAARFIATYFRRYDGVRKFMDETLVRARDGEAVRSLLGRRRVVPDIKSGNRARRLAAERIAMNMPIQGSAADILKLAMLQLADPVTPGTKMVLTVHDELVFEIPNDEVTSAEPRIVAAMESAYALSVPLTVDIGHGPNWNQAH